MNKKVIICILNKNEAKNLKTISLKIKKISKKIKTVFIDGGSTDTSQLIAKKIGLEILNWKKYSRGTSIIKAIDKYKKKYKYIIFTSSDGEENINDIKLFIKEFKDGADLVIASRLLKGGFFKSNYNKLWIHRKLYLQLISFLVRLFFGGNIKDCWNGFRGFKLSCFKKIELVENDYLVEAESTIKFLKKGLIIKEFPTIEKPRKYGVSSNSIIKSGFGHIYLILKNIIYR